MRLVLRLDIFSRFFKEMQVSVNMFVENGQIYLKSIIPKTKTVTIAMTPTERKPRGYLI